MKKKNERNRKYWLPQFCRKREEKGTFNNLRRNETTHRESFLKVHFVLFHKVLLIIEACEMVFSFAE